MSLRRLKGVQGARAPRQIAFTELAKRTARETIGGMRKTPRRRRAVVLLHIADRSDLVWITPLVQHAKVEAYVTADRFELVELVSDGFESAETPDFFNKGFQMLEDGQAEILLLLKLEGGRLMPWDPKAG